MGDNMETSTPIKQDIAKFMQIVDDMAKNSGCIRKHRQFGAAIVQGGRVISTGFNIAPPGTQICRDIAKDDTECIRYNIPSGTRIEETCCVCAEQNAILACARDGIAISGADMYTSAYPCPVCMRFIITSGIRRVFYREFYPSPIGQDLAKQSGIELVKVD